MKKFLFLFLLLLTPRVTLAATSTTQDCTSVIDASNDVDTRVSQNKKTPAEAMGADIMSAKLSKQSDGWDLDGTLVKPLTLAPDIQASFIFLFDRDRDIKNNSAKRTDVRSGFDVYYALNVSQKQMSATTTRFYYDPTRDSWKKIETHANASVQGALVHLHVPFDEMSADTAPRWRFGAGLGSKSLWVARDVVPDVSDDPTSCGFVLAPTSTASNVTMSPANPAKSSENIPYRRLPSILLVLLGVGVMIVALVASKRKG